MEQPEINPPRIARFPLFFTINLTKQPLYGTIFPVKKEIVRPVFRPRGSVLIEYEFIFRKCLKALPPRPETIPPGSFFTGF